MSYFTKLKISGQVVEQYYYPTGMSSPFPPKSQQKKERRVFSDLKNLTVDETSAIYQGLSVNNIVLERQDYSIRRAKSLCRDLVNCNASDFINGKFITFTFAPILKGYEKLSITDLDHANLAIHNTILNLRNAFCLTAKKFKYVTVVQFQKDIDFYGNKKSNGGAIHYHMVTNIADGTYEYKNFEKLVGWDKYGKTNNRKIDNRIRELGLYMTRYIQKDFADPRLRGRKVFWGSHNLKKPIMLYDGHVEFAKEAMGITKNIKPVVDNKSFKAYGDIEGFYTLWRLDYNPLGDSQTNSDFYDFS